MLGSALGAVALLVGAGVGTGVGTAAEPPVAPGSAPVAAGSLLAGTTGDDDPGGVARGHGVPLPEVPPCLPPVRACVDLGTDHAWLLDNGRVVRGPVAITAGDEDHPTPVGGFTVQWKTQTWTSREFGVPMPWSVFFAEGGIAFHEGDPEVPSAGCVKLGAGDARAFYAFLQVGDRVQVV